MASARFLGSLTQSGADTSTSFAIETNLTIDSKTGIEIQSLEIFWENGETAVAADWEMNFILATTTATSPFNSPDEITRISWGMQNTGGVAVAVSYEPQKDKLLFLPRVTVQPILYVNLASTSTGQANQCRWRINYDTVKLSELEVMRLLVGGV